MDKLKSGGKTAMNTVTEMKIDEKSIFAPLYKEVEKVEILYRPIKSKGFRPTYEILSFNSCPNTLSFRIKIRDLYKACFSELSKLLQDKLVDERNIIMNNCEVQIRGLKETVHGNYYNSYEDISWPKRFTNCECIPANKIDGKVLPNIIENIPPNADETDILHHDLKIARRNSMKNDTYLLKAAEPFALAWLESVDEMIPKLEYLLEGIAQNELTTWKKININEGFIGTLTGFLKDYFPDTTDSELRAVLSGKEIKRQLIFHGAMRQFIDVFWLLHNMTYHTEITLIKNGKVDTIKWIVDTFTYKKTNSVSPEAFKPGSINITLNSQTRLCKHRLSPDLADVISAFFGKSEKK